MWSRRFFAIGLLVAVTLMLNYQTTTGNKIETVSKSPDGKCFRETDKLTLGVSESKTEPGCIELYCRFFQETYYIQEATCPSVDDKPGCTKVEGVKDKIFPECCATQKCA